MIRHLLRLVWNRKRHNLLLIVEIFLSFVVLFAVTFFVAYNAYNWRQPLGFEIDRIWTISMGYPSQGPPDTTAVGAAAEEQTHLRAAAAETFRRALAALDDLADVDARAASFPSVPYNRGGWYSVVGSDNRPTQTFVHMVTDEFQDVLGLKLVAGRWFARTDDGAVIRPVVVNARLARELFGESSPIGKEIPPVEDGFKTPLRVVGVIEEFRHEGELRSPSNALLMRLTLPETLPNLITVRVRTGTPAGFEETLATTLATVAPDWTFEIRPLETSREYAIRKAIAPFAVAAIPAAFLLLMVALGITGVVWQSVTLRIQEFGLRRAKGATASSAKRAIWSRIIPSVGSPSPMRPYGADEPSASSPASRARASPRPRTSRPASPVRKGPSSSSASPRSCGRAISLCAIAIPPASCARYSPNATARISASVSSNSPASSRRTAHCRIWRSAST